MRYQDIQVFDERLVTMICMPGKTSDQRGIIWPQGANSRIVPRQLLQLCQCSALRGEFGALDRITPCGEG